MITGLLNLSFTGDDFPNAQALLESILEMEVEHPELQSSTNNESYDINSPPASMEAAPQPAPTHTMGRYQNIHYTRLHKRNDYFDTLTLNLCKAYFGHIP